MSTPVIPKPTGFKLVEGAQRLMLIVPVSKEHKVVLEYDELNLSLFLADWRLSGPSLGGLIRDGETARGIRILTAEVNCGGTVDRFNIEVSGDETEVGYALNALPFFYDCTKDPELRKVMRSVYRSLERHSKGEIELEALSA